jgi:NAD(P)H dehydrogenase (quinone)
MEKILVTGASGQLGKEVTKLLLSKIEAKQLSVLVRDVDKVKELKAEGVTIHQGDYTDYASLVKAFQGTDKLYFVSTSALTDRNQQHENVIKAAKEAKVKHVIYTSFQRKLEDSSSPIFFLAEVHLYTEKLLKESGMAYTILKHGLYADFIPILLGKNVIENKTIYLPAGEGRVAFTLRSDLAKGAVEIITGTGHENKVYEFCCDKTYSFNDIASIISDITGKSITYISPSSQEFVDKQKKEGIPEGFIYMTAGCSQGIKQGEFALSDNTLSKALGRLCTPLADFLRSVYGKQ